MKKIKFKEADKIFTKMTADIIETLKLYWKEKCGDDEALMFSNKIEYKWLNDQESEFYEGIYKDVALIDTPYDNDLRIRLSSLSIHALIYLLKQIEERLFIVEQLGG